MCPRVPVAISSDARPRPRAVSVTTMLAFAYVCAFVATLWVPFVLVAVVFGISKNDSKGDDASKNEANEFPDVQ